MSDCLVMMKPEPDFPAKGSREATQFDKEMGERIRAERINQDLTLSELAERCGISHQQLQKYEVGTNRISLGMYRIICLALRVKLSYLLGDDPEPLTMPRRIENDLRKVHALLGEVLGE